MTFNELGKLSIESDGQPTIGTEIETIFTPNIHKARYTAETLLKMKHLGLDQVKNNYVYNNLDTKEQTWGLDAVNACIMHSINSMYKGLFYKPASLDIDVHPTLSLELSLTHMSFDNLIANRSIVQHVLNILKDFNYSVTPKTGIHFWIDYEAFGATTDELLSTIEKFYIFSYDNPDFLTKLTDRPDLTSSFLGDIRSMIGDPLDINKKSARKAFTEDKISFFKQFRDDPTKNTSLYNIVYNKKGKRAAEVRWFSSSLNFYNTLSRLETLIFIIEFCRISDYTELHTVNYLDYVNAITKERVTKGVYTDVRANTIAINSSLLV